MGARERRLALALVVAVVALLVPAWAWASAPMCDPSAATVEAPWPAPPADSGSIFFDGCPSSEELDHDTSHQHRNHAEGFGPFQQDLGIVPEAVNVPGMRRLIFDPWLVDSSGPGGVARGVYRPPR